MEENIEILFSPLDEEKENSLHLTEVHEVCPDGDFIQWARRVTGREDLFVYFHKERETFVLAQWVGDRYDSIPTCQELDTFDRPPDRGGWNKFPESYLKARCRSAHEIADEMRVRVKQMRSAERSRKVDAVTAKTEKVQSLKRRGLHLEAQIAQNQKSAGFLPDEGTDFIVDELKTSAAEKIITYGS